MYQNDSMKPPFRNSCQQSTINHWNYHSIDNLINTDGISGRKYINRSIKGKIKISNDIQP